MPKVIVIPSGDTIGIKLPLSKGNKSGYFNTNDDILSEEKQNVINLLMTMAGERVIHGNLGVSVQQYLFENITSHVKESIREMISLQMARWLPHIKIIEIKVLSQEDEAVLGFNDIKITLDFQLLENPDMFDTVQIILTP